MIPYNSCHPLLIETEKGLTMEPGDWISVVAIIVSLAALAVSLFTRKRDIDRDKKLRIQAQVLQVVSSNAGYRTILALDDRDGKTAERIKYLRRTAEQLKIAGAPELGKQLESFLDETRWPDAGEQTKKAREDFQQAVADFLRIT